MGTWARTPGPWVRPLDLLAVPPVLPAPEARLQDPWLSGHYVRHPGQRARLLELLSKTSKMQKTGHPGIEDGDHDL